MTDALTNLQKLPEMCASRNRVDEAPIYIKRGESGYYPAPADLDPDKFNADHGITKAQVLAMEFGSMCGWHVPGADPDHHVKILGEALAPKRFTVLLLRPDHQREDQ